MRNRRLPADGLGGIAEWGSGLTIALGQLAWAFELALVPVVVSGAWASARELVQSGVRAFVQWLGRLVANEWADKLLR